MLIVQVLCCAYCKMGLDLEDSWDVRGVEDMPDPKLTHAMLLDTIDTILKLNGLELYRPDFRDSRSEVHYRAW